MPHAHVRYAGLPAEEERVMRNRVQMLCAAALVLISLAPALRGQASNMFTATASAKSKGKTHTAPVRIAIEAFSPEADQKAVMSALKSVFTPVNAVQRAWHRISTKLSISRGLATSQFSAPTEKYEMKFTISAKM